MKNFKKTTSIFLTILIICGIFLLPSPLNADAAGTKTVYVEVPSSWGKVSCYLWNDSGSFSPWPGTEMSHVKDQIYCFDVPEEMINIIFYSSSSQRTYDLVIPGENKIYRIQKTSSGFSTGIWEDYSEDGSPSTEPTNPDHPKTVYFKAPESWSEIYCYVWNDKGNLLAWPGTVMSPVAGDIYMLEVPAEYNNIIFNNIANQTANLVIPGTDYIFCPASAGGKTITGSWVLYSEYKPPAEPVQPSTKGSTIYFEAPDNWDSPYIFAAKNNLAAPLLGEPMCRVTENIYSYTLEDDIYWFVFSNNGAQKTKYINYAGNNMAYSYKNETWSRYQSTEPSGTIPILLKKPTAWENATPYAYFWNGSDVPTLWPGYEMEHFNDDLYIIQVPAKYTNIVFSNPETHQQTVDISITDNNNHIFILNGGTVKSNNTSTGYVFTGTWNKSDYSVPPFEVYKADRDLNNQVIWNSLFAYDMPYKLIDDAAASDGLYNNLTTLYQKIANKKFRDHPEYFYEIVISDIIVQQCKTSEFSSRIQAIEEDSAFTLLKILSKLIKLEAGQTLKDISISSVEPALINTALQNYEKATGIAAADTISIFTSLRSHLKTLKDFIDNFSKYSAVSRVSKEKQTIIHRISEKCTIPEMKTALNHMEQMFSSSPYEQFLLAFQNSADKIFWDYLEKIVTTAYQPLGILSLAKDVGVLLSDGLFATGNISETYLQIHAVTKFDKLLKEVTLELKSSYVSTLQEQDALLLNNAIEMVYDTTDYGINLTRIYTDSVLQDNIASWVDSILGGKNEETHNKFTSYLDTSKGIVKTSRSISDSHRDDYKAQYHIQDAL